VPRAPAYLQPVPHLSSKVNKHTSKHTSIKQACPSKQQSTSGRAGEEARAGRTMARLFLLYFLFLLLCGQSFRPKMLSHVFAFAGSRSVYDSFISFSCLSACRVSCARAPTCGLGLGSLGHACLCTLHVHICATPRQHKLTQLQTNYKFAHARAYLTSHRHIAAHHAALAPTSLRAPSTKQEASQGAYRAAQRPATPQHATPTQQEKAKAKKWHTRLPALSRLSLGAKPNGRDAAVGKF
jgi:hypothetical protein